MKTPRAKLQPDRPWHMARLDDADIFAVQAVSQGVANDAQQRRAYDYIVRALCETERMTFWPGERWTAAPRISPKASAGLAYNCAASKNCARITGRKWPARRDAGCEIIDSSFRGVAQRRTRKSTP